MKTLVLLPGKVGPLPTYLTYLFLRFPGTLGTEESWDLSAFDTYDRRWTRQGQLWVRQGDLWRLVSPPNLVDTLATDPAAFGLQAPQLIGRFTAKVRAVSFVDPDHDPISGLVQRVKGATYLVLQGHEGERWTALTAALLAEGMELWQGQPGPTWVVADRGPVFVGPKAWSAPTPTDSGATFLLDRLSDGLRVSRQYEAGARAGVDTECLHQYRVYLRRVRSLASLGRLWTTVPEWARLKNVLRLLQQKTNELRDLDALSLDLPSLRALVPWGEGAQLEGWAKVIEARRKAEEVQVKAWLGSEEYRGLCQETDRLLADLATLGEPWTAAEVAAAAFSKAARSLKKSLKALGPSPADEALHEVRIETKRLRYVLEAFGTLGPAGPVKTLLGLVKETQEGLGRFQDRSILMGRLRSEWDNLRAAPSKARSIDPLAFGLLVGILAADHGPQKAQALADARRLRSKAFLRALDRVTDPNGGTSVVQP